MRPQDANFAKRIAWLEGQVATLGGGSCAPLVHHTRHESGGADAIKLDDLATPDDNTNLNVSTSAHGLQPKLPNDATKYLDGTGAYTVPSGGGGGLVALPTGWTLRNNIVVNDYLASTGLFVSALIVDNGSVNFRFASQTLSGASTYTLIATLTGVITLAGNSFTMGLFLSDATKLISFEVLVQTSNANQLEIRQASSVTSGGSIIAGPTNNLVATSGVTLKVVKDGTHRTYYYYSNGSFVQFYQEAASTFLTETEVGFGGLSVIGANLRVEVNLVGWSLA